jgi:hypothetical protein
MGPRRLILLSRVLSCYAIRLLFAVWVSPAILSGPRGCSSIRQVQPFASGSSPHCLVIIRHTPAGCMKRAEQMNSRSSKKGPVKGTKRTLRWICAVGDKSSLRLKDFSAQAGRCPREECKRTTCSQRPSLASAIRVNAVWELGNPVMNSRPLVSEPGSGTPAYFLVAYLDQDCMQTLGAPPESAERASKRRERIAGQSICKSGTATSCIIYRLD